MAMLISTLASSVGHMTNGERRFAERLLQRLEDDYFCWYHSPIGAKQLHPDLIVLNPRRGEPVLEIKDWKLQTKQKIDHPLALLPAPNGSITKTSKPPEQARMNALRVDNLLQLMGPQSNGIDAGIGE